MCLPHMHYKRAETQKIGQLTVCSHTPLWNKTNFHFCLVLCKTSQDKAQFKYLTQNVFEKKTTQKLI